MNIEQLTDGKRNASGARLSAPLQLMSEHFSKAPSCSDDRRGLESLTGRHGVSAGDGRHKRAVNLAAVADRGGQLTAGWLAAAVRRPASGSARGHPPPPAAYLTGHRLAAAAARCGAARRHRTAADPAAGRPSHEP